MADFEKKQFVDLVGLTKYDEKIKDYQNNFYDSRSKDN